MKNQLTGTILYIEDEEDYQILVKRILRKTGLSVLTADTGADGFAILQEVRPDLIILDINLPDTDGYAICAQLRQDPAWAELPILMLTVRRRPEEWLRGFSTGANDYISKPINPPELVERVISCLEGRSAGNGSEKSAEYQLVQAAASGNRKAFEVLIEQFREKLFDGMKGLGHPPAVAEDIVSGAFTSAYENVSQFRGESTFFTWLYRIALSLSRKQFERMPNVSIDHLSQGDESTLPTDFSEPDTVHDTLSRQELSLRAQDALRLVPSDYRDILEMYFMQDLSYEQIARKLDIPVGTVMSRLHKARKLLQESWQKREALALRLV